jgi:hypothetical protein
MTHGITQFKFLAMACIMFASAATPAMAADLASQVQAHLAVGEFAPAIKLANEAGDRAESDRLLRRVAVAQARSGNHRAALHTAQSLSDDRVRSAALSDIGASPIRLRGGGGGGNQVDFQPLIDLIKTTVAPETWDDQGGPGAIGEFAGGVYVDAVGTLKPLIRTDRTGSLTARRTIAVKASDNDDARKPSDLRKVSLSRLEKQVQLALAAGEKPSEAMRMMAGLQRIKYVFVYPEQGDIVVAGPAGDWQADDEGRFINKETGRPVLRLDDLVVVLRHMTSARNAHFGCNIKPTPDALAKTQAFLRVSSKTAIKPSRRRSWLEKVRATVGKQLIEVYGIDPRTRVGRVMVEADYRMKLVGMGLEKGTQDVPSYLSMVRLDKNGNPPPMAVLRWWFTLNYDAVHATGDRNAFEIRGPGVQVLSENEMLTRQGKRVHTNKSEKLNREFARNFTKHFGALAAKYPVYAELRNIFDLALVGALMREEHLADKAGWHMTCFGDPKQYQPALGSAARTVDTVINHRVIKGRHIIAGVSGGVTVNTDSLVNKKAIKVVSGGTLDAGRNSSKPTKLAKNAWWWD